ncbi:hypothetical protein HMPREF0294_2286 [Corynebacterium glucuronolyticum ATCC 51867]|uniref:Uncharacterized protein n=1 Tax=Corynebacterium glucuronolyticum ATCC 51866 TaxID=548478 RepID=A0ABP2DWS7_9CORY|nr:hypothetical protein HMPREF0294_2286 [Corynebacterium glucuronolyticum ATCC 51867]EEI64483.1 hypothetical protein HMPREF0293_0018 [Corynebacterium glucuronolyticum ATCC 51866]
MQEDRFFLCQVVLGGSWTAYGIEKQATDVEFAEPRPIMLYPLTKSLDLSRRGSVTGMMGHYVPLQVESYSSASAFTGVDKRCLLFFSL